MGMFDTIEVSDSLPTNAEMDDLGLNKRDWSLQTKDFDCCLDVYVLQDGQLYLKKYKVEEWVEGDPKADSLFDRLGHLHRDQMYLDPVKSTCEVNMYDYRQNVQEKWDCWCEWKATFIDGRLSHVELFKFEKTDNAERKAREEELWNRMRAEDLEWYNRYIFRTVPYRWFAGRIRNALFRTAEFLSLLAQYF
jgi:hypothetical protein